MQKTTRTKQGATYKNPLTDTLSEASRALNFREFPRAGDAEPLRVSKKAASLRTLNLTKTMVRLDANGNLVGAPSANMAGELVPCSTAIVNGSRVAQSGASLIFLPEHFAPQFVEPKTGMMMVQKFPRHFVNVDASEFAEVADDADVTATDRPIFKTEIKLDDLRQFSVKHHVGHKEQIDRGGEQVADEIMAAVLAGISRTADSVFLETVLAATPAAFSIGAAAAKGAHFEKLRALIGTDGTGAAFRADGQMVANNVPAELTAAMADSLIGWFERGAVVIGPDLEILAERTNTAGALDVTAWFSIHAVVPDTASFWSVAA